MFLVENVWEEVFAAGTAEWNEIMGNRIMVEEPYAERKYCEEMVLISHKQVVEISWKDTPFIKHLIFHVSWHFSIQTHAGLWNYYWFP